MPAVVMGSQDNSRRREQAVALRDINYNYDYPDGLDLRPGSKLHDKLADRIWKRAHEAHTELSARFPNWNEIDKTLTTYIDLTESEEDLKESDPLKPVSIVYPNSYAILETMLSYMVMAFFQNPIFRYQGTGPEDTVGAILLEKVIHQHCEYGKVPLALHTMFRDNFCYGMGVAVPTWKTTMGMIPRIEPELQQNWMGRLKEVGKKIVYERGIVHEGNKLMNIDPYLALPDPSVAINNIQDGEFFGWINRTNLMDLLTEEQNDEDMFNVKYLKHLSTGESSLFTGDKSMRGMKNNTGTTISTSVNKVDVIPMFVKLIPKDWKLGKGEYPEIWHFELGGDAVILKARESGFAHGRFPAAVQASEYDGYSSSPISRIEMLSGLQGVLNWLFNSHVANVRKSLNDMFVVDPYLVNINDLKDPRPGKLIRMRRPAWGRGVQHAVQQLGVSDVTRGNMADSGMITQLMMQLSGTDNPVMGNLRQGGPDRLTSAEFQGTMSGAVSRLERVARVSSYQALQDIALMFASHTQQLMDQETYVQTVGMWPEKLRKTYGTDSEPIQVSPFDLVINYDVIARDGSIPGGNFSQSWIQLYQIMASNPELMQQFDMVRVFKHIAINMGAKNVDDFEKRPVQGAMPTINTAPDDQVARQAEAGNLMPIAA